MWTNELYGQQKQSSNQTNSSLFICFGKCINLGENGVGYDVVGDLDTYVLMLRRMVRASSSFSTYSQLRHTHTTWSDLIFFFSLVISDVVIFFFFSFSTQNLCFPLVAWFPHRYGLRQRASPGFTVAGIRFRCLTIFDCELYCVRKIQSHIYTLAYSNTTNALLVPPLACISMS